MNNIKKIFGILILGTFISVFCYPFLHELGHALAAVITNTTLCEFRVLPTPYVVCIGTETGGFTSSFIGVSGMLLPLAFSLVLNSKNFWVWLFSFYIKVISAIAFGLSYAAVLCYENKIIWQNEDIVKIIELSGIGSSFWLVLMLAFFCFNMLIIYLNKPVKRIEDFFEI